VLDNARKKVLESHGKPFSVFCVRPEDVNVMKIFETRNI